MYHPPVATPVPPTQQPPPPTQVPPTQVPPTQPPPPTLPAGQPITDPQECINSGHCWVGSCILQHTVNAGYICCAAGEGPRRLSYPHLEPGTSVSICTNPPVPTPDQQSCATQNGCWAGASCISYHNVNAGYVCCGAGEGRGFSYPHFIAGNSPSICGSNIPQNSPTPVATSTTIPTPTQTKTPTHTPTKTPTPTSFYPTLPPCTTLGATSCKDRYTYELCGEVEGEPEPVKISFRCSSYGNTICGKDAENIYGCISITPMPTFPEISPQSMSSRIPTRRISMTITPIPSPTGIPGKIDNPYPPDYVPATQPCLGVLLQPDTCPKLSRFIDVAAAQGFNVIAYSGYRSYQEQDILYQDCERRKIEENNPLVCFVSPPGYSQHQSGRAVDLYLLINGQISLTESMTSSIPLAESLGLQHPISSDPPHFYIL